MVVVEKKGKTKLSPMFNKNLIGIAQQQRGARHMASPSRVERVLTADH